MKIWKLVAGILSIVFFVIVVIQSCAAGVVNTIEANGSTSGTTGMMVGFFMLAGGIVSIVVRQKESKGPNIALIVLFGLAAIIGFAGFGNYTDLIIWSVWCAINAVIALIALIKSAHQN